MVASWQKSISIQLLANGGTYKRSDDFDRFTVPNHGHFIGHVLKERTGTNVLHESWGIPHSSECHPVCAPLS